MIIFYCLNVWKISRIKKIQTTEATKHFDFFTSRTSSEFCLSVAFHGLHIRGNQITRKCTTPLFIQSWMTRSHKFFLVIILKLQIKKYLWKLKEWPLYANIDKLLGKGNQACNPGTEEDETEGLLKVWAQPSLRTLSLQNRITTHKQMNK